MLRSLRLSSLVVAIPLALLACRDSNTADDTPDIDAATDAPGTNGTTIQEVQNDAMVPGTPVELRGKVIVHIDTYGARVGNFYIMEPAGGEFSGLLVFGAPIEQVALLAPGDLVDIIGAEKDEFGLMTDDGTVTELVPVTGGTMTVTKVGTAPIPAPHVLDALAVGQMATAAREAEYEKWEGVLLEVRNVSVIDALRDIGTTDPDFQGFKVTGQLGVDSSLAAIPQMPDHVVRDECLASITGMGDYFFDYKVLPRATADIVKGGTGCPPPENTMELCGDSLDNDANGFTDCMDNGCRALSSCQVTTTVVNVQNGMVPDGSVASLTNVVVTAISFNRKNLWVADALQAAPNNGVYVFVGGSTAPVLPAEIVVGARINVVGTVDEFAGSDGGESVTEITFPTITFVSAPAGAPTPITGVTIPTLLDMTTGEPYEGNLIQLQNVRVTGPLQPTTSQRAMSAGAVTFIADDDMHRLTEPDGTCYASLIGIAHYNPFPDTNAWVFLPRGTVAGDVVTGGSCP